MQERINDLQQTGLQCFGAGITGRDLARFCSIAEIPLTVFEEKNLSDEEKVFFTIPFVSLHSGLSLSDIKFDNSPMVISPGVPLDNPYIKKFIREGKKILSEIDLSVSLIGQPLVAITGSNGKTTTTALTAKLLSNKDYNVPALGNIGRSTISYAIELYQNKAPSTPYVLEVSSFQLESSTLLAPQIAVILNLVENHLDRHKTMEAYAEIKKTVLRKDLNSNKTKYAILNADDLWFDFFTDNNPREILPFGRKATKTNLACLIHDQQRTLSIQSKNTTFDLSQSKLFGSHNWENIAAATLAATLAGVSPEEIQSRLNEFSPVEHRLELCSKKNLPTFINDSKSTTPLSTVAALRAVAEKYPESKIYLLVGGKKKPSPWKPVQEVIQEVRVKQQVEVFGFGKDGNTILNELGEYNRQREKEDGEVQSLSVEEAMGNAFKIASTNDVVLFSPGCASYDAFQNFEERGRKVKEIYDLLPS
jgi:UDP-N-acetylmuramoylalanine--D-glutamate ligase